MEGAKKKRMLFGGWHSEWYQGENRAPLIENRLRASIRMSLRKKKVRTAVTGRSVALLRGMGEGGSY